MKNIPAFHVESAKTFSLAAQQNAYPVIRSLQLDYSRSVGDELSDADSQPVLKNLRVILSTELDWLAEEKWVVDELRPGQVLPLQNRPLAISSEKLFTLTEEMRLTLSLKLLNAEDTCITAQNIEITLLPPNFWGGESRQPDLLAAFVKPNGMYVESLVRKVTEVLEANGHGRSADGYQSNTREKPYLMLAALWNVIFQQKLAYVSPPPGFAKQGQRIRLAADISSTKITACLDTSLLFASCIEAMGLNPVVAITQGHAFAGAWLINERFPVLTNDDPMDLRKRVDSRDMVLFETTLVTNAQPVTFEQAKEHARSLIEESKEADFVYVIDIAQARARQIKPLATIEEQRLETSAEDTTALVLPVAPPLPPVRADEKVLEESPETRINMWQRKLLDLTKKNNLLNLKDRAVSIKLYCPDIAAMEDSLADGTSFKFLSAEDSPLNDRERDKDNFRLASGSDIHRQYALDQLNSKVLIANQSVKRLEKNSINLLRKAKNDLEEGGSNTLFLALGMLKWKENPEDDRSYRAPLILVPVELIRRSACSPIYIKQLADEDPIFNLTLIEFLNAEHDINLNVFKDELPEDDSGVDVVFVWSTVREAVREHKGFEVVEELVLASFSFAKYLMWKDLKDRIGDLKENPFVKHLVDTPKEPYFQDASFVLQDEVDEKVDPEKIFTPLNCDSSQLVAVEASGKPQDFVLEGPPGTGKSETIANMICHNIALGRRVLFVAEKMAALNVVYRRMEKVGLDHLCLELHSNKANKRAILEQLRQAWNRRKGETEGNWLSHVSELKYKRRHLNEYVRALHDKSVFGVSVRDAISRIALYDAKQKFLFDWAMNFESAPVKNEVDLEQILFRSKSLAIAFSDVKGLDFSQFSNVNAISWSNSWQANIVSLCEGLKSNLPELEFLSNKMAKTVGIHQSINSIGKVSSLMSLSDLIDLAIRSPVDFALEQGAKERLNNIKKLAELKRKFDDEIQELGTGVTPELLRKSPVPQWKILQVESEGRWFKTFLNKMKLNSEAKKLGYAKFDSLECITKIEEASKLQNEIERLVKGLDKYSIWQGWKTKPESLIEFVESGEKIRKILSKIVGLADEPVDAGIALKKLFIDGRDYLEESKIVKAWYALEQKWKTVSDLREQAESLNFELPEDQQYVEIVSSAQAVISQQNKLKSWCEWQDAKLKANALQLSVVCNALESGSISESECEEQVMTAFCRWLAPLLLDNSDTLRQFKSSSHEELIRAFRELDAKVAETTSDYVSLLTAEKVPDPNSRKSPPEYGVLSRELQKKTRHKPIRALIQDLGHSLLDLCPCLMMSPLSVSQFLPADFNGFDLVVFDEASQMTTWDSVGAIARGKNVIVVGDPKQMPPTNFFASSASEGDPDEDDLESILDQALAARLPHKRLMGHYRSRHETLIAFSNSKYYENSLVTYPSPDTKESAVTFHRVNGVYAKGAGRNNPIEANAVVDEIVRRLKDPSQQHKSLGVVTLNTDQQRTIEDLLDDARRNNPDIEVFFQSTNDYDDVFVKNLESVQGDERDVIILSLGYGPTEPEARTMSMNFGPLNKQGGERRLNVAITRATSEVLLFASFDSSMIDLSRTSATAVAHLKNYMEFADRGPMALAQEAKAAHGVDQFDSDFEQAIAFSLREKGWRVQTQVGVSKFRVDLGVLHPDKPGLYLAGVECDGATYHSSPSARDRDRVRHIVLENLGWRLIRLWSTDYFVDNKSAIEKVHNRLSEILESDREKDEVVIDVVTEECIETTSLDVDDLDPNIENEINWDVGISQQEYNTSKYFDDSHKPVLTKMAKEILTEKPGITIHSLALEVANMHGLSRTSKKQLEHLYKLIKPWAGIGVIDGHRPAIWQSPSDVVDEIRWRGVDAFGDERGWKEISFQEAKGLARFALEKAPDNPVDFMCNEFKLKRRHETTLSTFKNWMSAIS